MKQDMRWLFHFQKLVMMFLSPSTGCSGLHVSQNHSHSGLALEDSNAIYSDDHEDEPDHNGKHDTQVVTSLSRLLVEHDAQLYKDHAL